MRMTRVDTPSRFKAKLRRPQTLDSDGAWALVVLPKAVSATLPRRGRTTVVGSFNGHPFQAMLEPDGQLTLRRISQSSGHRIGPLVLGVSVRPQQCAVVDCRCRSLANDLDLQTNTRYL
jgi:hypothetical protein